VLTTKLKERLAAIEIEGEMAFGRRPLPTGNDCPPPWALAAARIAIEAITGIQPPVNKEASGAEKVSQAGFLVGMARTLGSFLSKPEPAFQKEEKKDPRLTRLRLRIADMAQPHLELASGVERSVSKAELGCREQVAFIKAQDRGAAKIADEAGEPIDNTSIRAEMCFFIWLYWQDLRFIGSIAELRRFLAEVAPATVTGKNLEKICREIGLSFKGRGRPKNPTKVNTKVGIKKNDARVRQGNGNSRHRRKASD
jgi:hypothetical protein